MENSLPGIALPQTDVEYRELERTYEVLSMFVSVVTDRFRYVPIAEIIKAQIADTKKLCLVSNNKKLTTLLEDYQQLLATHARVAQSLQMFECHSN